MLTPISSINTAMKSQYVLFTGPYKQKVKQTPVFYIYKKGKFNLMNDSSFTNQKLGHLGYMQAEINIFLGFVYLA